MHVIEALTSDRADQALSRGRTPIRYVVLIQATGKSLPFTVFLTPSGTFETSSVIRTLTSELREQGRDRARDDESDSRRERSSSTSPKASTGNGGQGATASPASLGFPATWSLQLEAAEGCLATDPTAVS